MCPHTTTFVSSLLYYICELQLLYYCFTTALLLLYYCFTTQSELGDVYSVRFNLASTAGTCVFTTASLLLTRRFPLFDFATAN